MTAIKNNRKETMLANVLPRQLRRPLGGRFFVHCVLFILLGFLLRPNTAQAVIQFDPFLGYDGVVPEVSWFPLVCEIKNDEAAFTGVIEVGDAFGQGQKTTMIVELPTGTLKRVVLPLFAGSRGYRSYNIRLLDERGKVRAEQMGIRPRKTIPSGLPLVCGLTRTVGGVPVLKQGASSNPEHQIPSARLQAPIFPDNPLVLEGMQALYLNTERAADLNLTQVAALHAWLHAGGQLIVGVEQAGDVNARPWLKELLPCEIGEFGTVESHPELQHWLRRAEDRPDTDQSVGASTPPQRPRLDDPDDGSFESTPAQFLSCTVKDGTVLVSVGGKPAIVEAARGRGRVTLLLFNPEREPFRAWKNLPSFWSKVVGVPEGYYARKNFVTQPYYSADGVFGALLDTRQVNKLPYHWLLLLLVVYLIVIGPLDMYWLRKINRPMLTWITFPCYVVFFSGLIYFIGYMLRAGESEWNELHVVDVTPLGEKGEMRGRTFASVYSPSNQRFELAGQQRFAAFRPEFAAAHQSSAGSDKGKVLIAGDNYKADLFVPVWTSQLMVSEWWQAGIPTLSAKLSRSPNALTLSVENKTGRTLPEAQFVAGGMVFKLGALPVGTKSFELTQNQSRTLANMVMEVSGRFQSAVQSRQHAFGGSQSGRLDDPMGCSVAVSFLSSSYSPDQQNQHMSFLTPPGLDLTPLVENGNAFLLAWDAGQSPTKNIHQFSPKRSSKNTLWRVLVN